MDLQERRISGIVRMGGDAANYHKSRGKKSHNWIAGTRKGKTVNLCRDKYKKFCLTYASEKLLTVHKIRVRSETLRGSFHGEQKNPPPGF